MLDLIISLKELRYSFAIALIKSNYPLYIQDEEGKTALMIAISQNKNDIIDLILESNSCDNKSLSIVEKYGDNVLSLCIKLNRDVVILQKILERMKYNLYKELDEEILKCKSEITSLELEQLSIDFNLETIMSNLKIKVNPIDILKSKKIKLEEDLELLNNGISWIDDNMNTLGINHAIQVAIKFCEKTKNDELLNLLVVPPPGRVVLKKINNVKRVYKRPSPKIRTLAERRTHEEEEKKKKAIEKRSMEQKLRREKMLSKRRNYGSDTDDSEIDGRIIKSKSKRKSKSKSKDKRKSKSKSKKNKRKIDKRKSKSKRDKRKSKRDKRKSKRDKSKRDKSKSKNRDQI
jgi:hypothetical protein